VTAPDDARVPSALAFTSRPPRVSALDELGVVVASCAEHHFVWFARPGAPARPCPACARVIRARRVCKPMIKRPRGTEARFADALRERWTDDA
jgi:hypothetical protein